MEAWARSRCDWHGRTMHPCWLRSKWPLRSTRPSSTVLEVRVPRSLADVALLSWQRDDDAELGDETPEQRVVRDRAGSLALIGLAVESRAGWKPGTWSSSYPHGSSARHSMPPMTGIPAEGPVGVRSLGRTSSARAVRL